MWIETAKKLSFEDVAQRVSLGVRRGKSWGPCPACGAESRGSDDKRGPIRVYDKSRWTCFKCNFTGDTIDLVTFMVHGRSGADLKNGEWQDIRKWFGLDPDLPALRDQGAPVVAPPKKTRKSVTGDLIVPGAPPEIPEPYTPANNRRPLRSEVTSLWRSSKLPRRLSGAPLDLAVSEFIAHRGYDPEVLSALGVCRVLPEPERFPWPSWWPREWAHRWRLAVPAFEVDGAVGSLQARSCVIGKSTPKTLWPKGYDAGRLFMANRSGLRMLRRRANPMTQGVLITEGLTSFLSAASADHVEGLQLAILSGTSGSFRALSDVFIPTHLKVYVGCDLGDKDATGDKYFSKIVEALPHHDIHRLHFESPTRA